MQVEIWIDGFGVQEEIWTRDVYLVVVSVNKVFIYLFFNIFIGV